MKKIIILATAALFSILLSGCNAILDVQPEGTPTVDTYFQNDSQAENAMKSIYAPLYNDDNAFSRELYWEQMMAGTMMVVGRTRPFGSTLFTLEYNGDDSPLSETYTLFMSIISRCNWVVQSLLNKQQGTELTYVEKRTLGEAYFMRGFLHFTLAYRYGTKDQGIPAVQYEKVEGGYNYEIPTQQATVMDNYAMIEADYNAAMEYLPDYSEYTADERGRAHKGAALGMKARLYAYWATWDKSKWNDVITVVNQLEQAPYNRDLAPSYDDLFGVNWNYGDPNGWWGAEYIWSFPSNGGNDSKRGGVEWPGVILENSAWGCYNGWGQAKPTLDAYREFKKDGDTTWTDASHTQRVNQRLYKCILQYNQPFMFATDKSYATVAPKNFFSTSDIETGFAIGKWMEPFGFANAIEAGYLNWSPDWPTTRCNFHVLRFADCLLLRAEAYLVNGNVAGATTDINRVRRRVGLPDVGAASWSDIYHERFCEMAYEPASDHLADLKRWAVSGADAIKALAIKELEKHPDVLHYINRSDPASALDPSYDYATEGGSPYEDLATFKKVWADYKIVFPYPSNEISKSAGKLKQNAGY